MAAAPPGVSQRGALVSENVETANFLRLRANSGRDDNAGVNQPGEKSRLAMFGSPESERNPSLETACRDGGSR